MEPSRRWYTRKGTKRINPEHVIIRGRLVPTGFYGGIGTGAQCPDCHTTFPDDWYSEPGKIHPDAESLVSASVDCKSCGSKFELYHRTEDEIGGGIETARKELRPIQMANALFAKAVVDGIRDHNPALQDDIYDAIVRRCDEQRNGTTDPEVRQHLGFLSQGLKMLYEKRQ